MGIGHWELDLGVRGKTWYLKKSVTAGSGPSDSCLHPIRSVKPQERAVLSRPLWTPTYREQSNGDTTAAILPTLCHWIAKGPWAQCWLNSLEEWRFLQYSGGAVNMLSREIYLVVLRESFIAYVKQDIGFSKAKLEWWAHLGK